VTTTATNDYHTYNDETTRITALHLLKSIYVPNILQLMLRHGSHATAHYSREIDMIFRIRCVEVRGEWTE
jgi:hypothetical protein